MISGATIIYLSATDWAAPWHMSQEIALRLGAEGNRVLFVETLGWRRPRPFDIPRMAGRLARALRGRFAHRSPSTVAPGVILISPILVPGLRSRPGVALNSWLLRRGIARRLRASSRPRILWIYTPSPLTVRLVGAFGEDLSLYHCTQSHADRPVAPPGTAQTERDLIALVDAVVVDGIRLFDERTHLHRFVYRIPGGVNIEQHAGSRPPGFAAGLRRPIIGYLGTVDHRIDPALLVALARSRPDATVLVVGPVVDADVRELEALPNVVMHGQVPIEEVPSVLSAFDVGVMPYADQPMTSYTYPAKLHQYLAAGLPIASTPLPDLAEFSDLVEVGEGPSGLAAAVDRALAAPSQGDERRRVAGENTWARRVDDLSAVLEGHLAGEPPPSSAGAKPDSGDPAGGGRPR